MKNPPRIQLAISTVITQPKVVIFCFSLMSRIKKRDSARRIKKQGGWCRQRRAETSKQAN